MSSTKITAPDGGWGYMCIIGSFITMCFDALTEDCFGILYLIFLDKFESTATVTAWIGGSGLLLKALSAPLASVLCLKIGYRLTTALGTLLQVIGFIITGFAPNIILVFIGYSALVCVGASFTTVAGSSILVVYFDKKRAMASSLGSTGVGIMMFAAGPLIEYVRIEYGYTGIMLICSGITLQGFIAALLFRPLVAIEKPKPLRIFVVDNDRCEAPQIQLKAFRKISEAREHSLPEGILENGVPGKLNCSMNPAASHPHLEGNTNKQIINETVTKTSLKTNPLFYAIIIVNIFIPFCDGCVSSFLPSLAIEKGVARSHAVMLVSWAGISNTVHKIFWGFILDIAAIRSRRIIIYMAFGIICGVINILFPLCTSYASFIAPSVIFNGYMGAFFAQRFTVVCDLLGEHTANKMFGFVVLCNIVGHIVSPLLGGLIKDYIGSYDIAFYALGTIATFSGVLFILIPLFVFMRKKYNAGGYRE